MIDLLYSIAIDGAAAMLFVCTLMLLMAAVLVLVPSRSSKSGASKFVACNRR